MGGIRSRVVIADCEWAPRTDVAWYLVRRKRQPQQSGWDKDVMGLGVAQANFSRHLEGPAETALELFYKVRCSQSMSVEPDLQYLANPSGEHRDAFACGVQIEVVL